MAGWRQAGAPPVTELRNETKQADLMHAVAHGAAYYGLARTGKGVRIRGGVPRTYYVGIESSLPAVPGLPAPMKALRWFRSAWKKDRTSNCRSARFALVVGEPAEFRFFSSLSRKSDAPGYSARRSRRRFRRTRSHRSVLPPHRRRSAREDRSRHARKQRHRNRHAGTVVRGRRRPALEARVQRARTRAAA